MTLTEYGHGLPERWHPTKNGALTPQQVTVGSHRLVWWRCGRGHEWQAMVFSAAAGCDCPYCAGRLPLPGETDLAATHPAVAAQWDAEKNAPLTPRQVTAGSDRAVWWRCERGHSFSARIFSRAGGAGCPYCTNRKVLAGFNDLATTHPALAEQWHPVLNGALAPQQVTRGSRRSVWWRCALGHVWKAAVYARTRPYGGGCPICAGKVKCPPAWERRRPAQPEQRPAPGQS